MLFRDAHLQSGCDTASASGCITVIWPLGFLIVASFALLIDTNGNQDVALVLGHSPKNKFLVRFVWCLDVDHQCSPAQICSQPLFSPKLSKWSFERPPKAENALFSVPFTSVSFWSQRIRDEVNGTTLQDRYVVSMYNHPTYPPYPLRASNRIFTPNHKDVALLWWRSLSRCWFSLL